MTYNRLYHYTTKENFESIKISHTIDCRKDCRTLYEQSLQPITTHLCCTIKEQCNYEYNMIDSPQIVILELLVPTNIHFELIDHGQLCRMEIQPGSCYVISANTSRIEYLISCELATIFSKHTK